MGITLEEAKNELKKGYMKGVTCPCCDQHVKMYKRKLNAGMSKFLIGLHKETNRTGEVYISSGQVLKAIKSGTKSMDFSILRHWGLIKEKTHCLDSKKNSGMWKITHTGKAFAEGNYMVQSHVKIYDNRFYGVTGSM
ncbi:unnamed protein product, partial [marine sediment metagenome]